MDYIKLVVVEQKERKMLCFAPAFSNIHEGDIVMVSNEQCVVVCEIDVSKSTEHYSFILKSFGFANTTKNLLKITSKITVEDLNYEE